MENNLEGAQMLKSFTHTEHREWLVNLHVEEAVSRVYQAVFAEDLTTAESRLAWMRVIEKLLQSVAIERQTEATKEWLKL
jgi:hypothetical protein